MSESFEINAEPRADKGTGASRRLRRQGRVPAIIYGGKADPQPVSLDQNEIVHQLENEAFYSHILSIKVGGTAQRVVLRDLQRHPFKRLVTHADFQRVSADEKIRVHVPLHFINEESSRGVKREGGEVSHLMIDVEVSCLPDRLPEFIEVDLADLGVGEAIHLSELTLPEGVETVALAHGADYDAPVVNIHHARVAEEKEIEEGEEVPGAEAPPKPEEGEY